MRIGFVTQWFTPEPGTLVAAAVAQGLASRGHEVHVLTGFPNYPSGQLQPGYPLRPYRRDEPGNGLTVHRAPLFPSHDRSAGRRALNYLSFASTATVVGRLRVPTPDVWLVYSSPATAALPALLARRRDRAPIFLVIQDLWPDSVMDSAFLSGGAARLAEHTLNRFCDWSYSRAAAIGVISPSMRAVLGSRGVPAKKIFDTPNWVEDAHVSGQPTSDRAALGLPRGRTFMYAGNMGDLQGLGPLLSAFAHVPSAHLVLVGDGVARSALEEQTRREGLTNISFVPPQPMDRIGAYIQASDVQIVSLRDTPLLRATMPSKVQSSLAAGKPILAHAAGDVAALVDTHDVGRSARPGDLDATVRAIEFLAQADAVTLEAMGRASRRLYEARYSPAAGLDGIESMLMTTLTPTPTPTPGRVT